jgi:Calcineurin-like phosphoesterase
MNPPRRHFVIPDCQVKKGVPTDHMAWIGKAIQNYKPDVVIHLGDHWDFPSLSRYDAPGSMAMEGSRVDDDIQAGNDALEVLTKSMGRYKCRKIILRGNHEQRLERAINNDPRLAGTIGYHLLNDKRLGWEVVDYFCGAPGQITLDGVVYAHYFAAVNTGRAIGGTANNKLNHVGESFVQGHVQGLDPGSKQYATGRIKQGFVAGSCYLHDEDYKGMANNHWRGVLVLNEVRNGEFCAMPLTLDYLCRKFEGRSLSSFLRRKYKNAQHRFTLARNA